MRACLLAALLVGAVAVQATSSSNEAIRKSASSALGHAAAVTKHPHLVVLPGTLGDTQPALATRHGAPATSRKLLQRWRGRPWSSVDNLQLQASLANQATAAAIADAAAGRISAREATAVGTVALGSVGSYPYWTPRRGWGCSFCSWGR